MELTKEQKKIRDNALLLAEFEGYEVETESTYGNIFYSEDNQRTAIDTAYHTLYGRWLKSIIDKIEEVLENLLSQANTGDNNLLDEWYKAYKHKHLVYESNKVVISVNVNKVYKEAIKFVKWYNLNVKPKVFEESKLSYSEYLFGQLMQSYLSCGNIPYDRLFEETKALYKCFEDSDENIETKGEYECIERYIRNNESFITNSLNKWE